MNTPIRRRRALPLFLLQLPLVAALVGCAAPSTPPLPSTAPVVAPSAAIREAIAPTGKLRIAVYPGSPTSLLRQGDRELGLSVEVGRELARRLGVPSELVVHERVAQVVETLRQGQADVTITNASAARAQLVDFVAPVVGLELGVLTLDGSPITAVDQIDRAGGRIGVSEGSSSQAALGARLKQSTIVTAPSLKAAGEMLRDRRIDGFATNKGILFTLSDELPGSKVLPGKWGTESLTLAVPKGRTAGQAWLRDFVSSVRASGLVEQAAARAGLRGVTEPGR